MLMYGPYTVSNSLAEHPACLLPNLTRRTIRSSDAYCILKKAVKIMAEDGLRVAVCGREGESSTFRLVYWRAQVGDTLWRVQNCPLPVVLRLSPDEVDASPAFAGEVFLRTSEGEAHWTDGTGWQAEDFGPGKWRTIEIV